MRIMNLSFVFLLCQVLSAPVLAQRNQVSDHPGFVDFSMLSSIAGIEPTVEVSLQGPILTMMTNLIRNQNVEAANFISTLLSVSVQVFESQEIVDAPGMSSTMSEIAASLDANSWSRIIRVREENENVDVFFRLSDNGELIHGITIMVAEIGETVLVNIAGDISPDDISAIAQRFNIQQLEGLD